MHFLYTLIILLSAVHCCAMENQMSFCEQPPLKKQKTMSMAENDLGELISRNIQQIAATELNKNGNSVADDKIPVNAKNATTQTSAESLKY